MPYGTPVDKYPSHTVWAATVRSTTESVFHADIEFFAGPGVSPTQAAADVEFQKFVDLIDSSADFEFANPSEKLSTFGSEVTPT